MIDDPNLVLPLATSYNERGVAGYTHVVTNAEDQRKVNCMYEPVRNQMSGKGTLSLIKRPGVTVDNDSYGVSSQDAYNIALQLTGGVKAKPLVVAINSSGHLTASIPGTTTILESSNSLSGRFPAFIDKTRLGSVASMDEYMVIQARYATEDFSPPIVSVSQKVYYSPDATNVTWNQISDADFPGIVGKMEHIDGYAFGLTTSNLIFNSDLNSLQNWTATSFLAKQIKQDYARGLARLKNQLLAFGDETVEAFYNAGHGTGSPLGRLAHLHNKIGLVDTEWNGGTHYYATVEERLYFVGRRSGGQYSVGVFMFDGARFERVSSTYIDKLLSEATIYSVNQIGLNGQSGIAICVTAPTATTQRSFVFFPEWKEWFEWVSTIFSPVNCGAWFLPCSTGNKHKVYNFTASDNWQDAGTSYPWTTQFRIPSNGSTRHFMTMYGVDADTDTSANLISVEASDNDCQSFYSLPSLDLTQERKVNFRGGSYRKRHLRLTATDARPKRIHNFLARIE